MARTTWSQSAFYITLNCIILNKKEWIHSLRKLFFPLRVDPIFKAFKGYGKQVPICKSYLPLKDGDSYSLSIPLKKKQQILQLILMVKLSVKLESAHDKTNKMDVSPAKTRISLGISPVWSESLFCAQWVAKGPSFLHAYSSDSDQTGYMTRLI